MKDRVANPREKVGFIAQEVQALVPQAVTMGTGVVPDVLQLCSVAGGRIVSAGDKIAAGDRLQIVARDGREATVTVQAVDESGATVDDAALLNDDKIFVRGHEVDDFLHLDTDPIIAVTVGAVQQLQAKHAATEQALRARVATLEGELATIKAYLGL